MGCQTGVFEVDACQPGGAKLTESDGQKVHEKNLSNGTVIIQQLISIKHFRILVQDVN